MVIDLKLGEIKLICKGKNRKKEVEKGLNLRFKKDVKLLTILIFGKICDFDWKGNVGLG